MTEIISPENTELLTYIMGGAHKQSYVHSALNLQNEIEQKLESGELEKVDTGLVNHFAPKIYLREFSAKAGTLVVSKMHRTEHFIMFLTGSLSVMTENGIEYIKAPCIQRTMPGTKRIAYFHEDSTCMTIHPTENTDVQEIEKEIIVPSGEEEEYLISIGHSTQEFIE
ncbi:hypothetical protein [Acinetobacter sp. BSP-53]|uniref:hypothetical protein n=1 Tax=Acinetobacter sp. BSP-53 TaxID=3344662 RepID=UPI0037706263